MSIRHPLTLASVLALTFGLAACGGDDADQAAEDTGTEQAPDDDTTTTDTDDADSTGGAGTDATSAPGTFPVTVDTVNGEVTVTEQPERIVSLSPSATEILFAIGAGDQVIAVDDFSTYPEEAPTTDLSGFEPNVEAILGYEPDLVVVAYDTGDLVASLEAVDVPVIMSPAPVTVEAGWDDVAALGLATGQVDQAAATIADLRDQVSAAFDSAPQDGEELRVYHELDETYFAASSASFIGDVYTQLGAVNIADDADTDGTGFPQLTEESIIEANPQLIVISDQATYSADDVANRPGWSEVDAVRNGDIVVVDADIASRWGPRLPQLVGSLADALNEVEVASAPNR